MNKQLFSACALVLVLMVIATFVANAQMEKQKKQFPSAFTEAKPIASGVWVREVGAMTFVQFNAQIQMDGSGEWYGVTISIDRNILKTLVGMDGTTN